MLDLKIHFFFSSRFFVQNILNIKSNWSINFESRHKFNFTAIHHDFIHHPIQYHHPLSCELLGLVLEKKTLFIIIIMIMISDIKFVLIINFIILMIRLSTVAGNGTTLQFFVGYTLPCRLSRILISYQRWKKHRK